METKFLLLTLGYLLISTSWTEAKSNGGIKFESGGRTDRVLRSIYNSVTGQKMRVDDTESSGSGDDEDIISGSGSGDGEKSDEKNTNPLTTRLTPKKTEGTTKPTLIDIKTSEATKAKTGENDIKTLGSTKDPSNTVAYADTPPEEGGVDFTIGIIIGVVVGAVLAILVIVFLVYRLRKKDEGSYSLDEQCTQSFIKDDKTNQGKEYFA